MASANIYRIYSFLYQVHQLLPILMTVNIDFYTFTAVKAVKIFPFAAINLPTLTLVKLSKSVKVRSLLVDQSHTWRCLDGFHERDLIDLLTIFSNFFRRQTTLEQNKLACLALSSSSHIKLEV
jgi:hypothetical protein